MSTRQRKLLDKIADRVLVYCPKPKSKAAKRRAKLIGI